jgi:acyl-CoA reductase-like NAD-dependent aldehyde dehydrogenase
MLVHGRAGGAIRLRSEPEAKTTVDIIRYFGGLGGELKGETIPLDEHVLSYTRREPLGVVGAIIPWNAPVLLAALKISPALCAGNTLVLKAAVRRSACYCSPKYARSSCRPAYSMC